MTAPNQDQSAEAQEGLIASIGQGALEIGGGDWSFGQDLTEEWGKSQYQIPGFSGVEDDSDSILAILYTLLTRLSSDVLDIIKTFIPGGALIEVSLRSPRRSWMPWTLTTSACPWVKRASSSTGSSVAATT